jgi:lipid A 3-O-deacylase
MHYRRGGFIRIIAGGALVSLAATASIPAQAGPYSDSYSTSKLFPAVSETRLGVFATNLEDGAYDEGPVIINGEILFGRFRPDYAEPWKQFLFNPRIHLGGSFNPHADGVSEGYAGLTWEMKLTDRMFFETSFGGTVHNGDTESYGCSTLFRESASLGVDLTSRLRLMATVDHASHAGLCGEQNKGLTNAGLRLGYKW